VVSVSIVTARIRRTFWHYLAPVLATALLALAIPGQSALASDSYASSGIGYDVSFPQCITDQGTIGTTTNGIASQFGVVGVTHGRAFTRNPCLDREVQAAIGQGLSVSFYLNLNAPHSAQTSEVQNGPQQTCGLGDDSCAYYNYGWNTAQDAYSYATQTLGVLGATSVPAVWWLDVEVANYWAKDPSLNDQVIQGAIDFLHGVTSNSRLGDNASASALTIGIYSVPAMWRGIAGATYQPGVPAWVVGSHQLGAASRYCAQTSFTGGPVLLVQSVIGGNDWDYAC
jgi:hypothetical protein